MYIYISIYMDYVYASLYMPCFMCSSDSGTRGGVDLGAGFRVGTAETGEADTSLARTVIISNENGPIILDWIIWWRADVVS
jgi:hypothetical protein